MFGFGKKEPEDEYTRGYNASREFGELMRDDVTHEELTQHWDIVEANHTDEYMYGYQQYVLDEMSRPWWKIW